MKAEVRWWAIICPCGCKGPLVNKHGEPAIFIDKDMATRCQELTGVGEVKEVEITLRMVR